MSNNRNVVEVTNVDHLAVFQLAYRILLAYDGRDVAMLKEATNLDRFPPGTLWFPGAEPGNFWRKWDRSPTEKSASVKDVYEPTDDGVIGKRVPGWDAIPPNTKFTHLIWRFDGALLRAERLEETKKFKISFCGREQPSNEPESMLLACLGVVVNLDNTDDSAELIHVVFTNTDALLKLIPEIRSRTHDPQKAEVRFRAFCAHERIGVSLQPILPPTFG